MDQFTPLPIKGINSQNTAVPALEEFAPVLNAVATAGLPTYGEGRLVTLSTDLTGVLRTSATLSGTSPVNISQIGGNTVTTGTPTSSSSGTIQVSLSTDSTANGYATTAYPGTYTTGTYHPLSLNLDGNLRVDMAQIAGANISATNPLTVKLSNGTAALDMDNGTSGANTLRVSIATDDFVKISATTTANIVTNPIFTQLTDGTNPIGTATNPFAVTFETPGTITDQYQTTASVAAGASATHTYSPAVTGDLIEITASSSVRLRIELQAPSATVKRVFFTEAFKSFVYKFPDKDIVSVTNPDAFILSIKNMDNSKTADIYSSATWSE